jgi:hypothetical protein
MFVLLYYQSRQIFTNYGIAISQENLNKENGNHGPIEELILCCREYRFSGYDNSNVIFTLLLHLKSDTSAAGVLDE